ncbi:MAG: hypothetical protein A3I66_02645 [Burkholderiales bacterium RIFCSPLOWO2_02_FULL_57_36]|nr:MAG: hypothetical protein A3I66_02645 [Burkholderiales bacterium RIFCSPLOWO2_02_FULL_57_36]
MSRAFSIHRPPAQSAKNRCRDASIPALRAAVIGFFAIACAKSHVYGMAGITESTRSLRSRSRTRESIMNSNHTSNRNRAARMNIYPEAR